MLNFSWNRQQFAPLYPYKNTRQQVSHRSVWKLGDNGTVKVSSQVSDSRLYSRGAKYCGKN